MKYGFTDGRWEDGKSQMVTILRSKAKERLPINYGDLSGLMKRSGFEIHHKDPAMDRMLYEVSVEEEASLHSGIISAVVVRKDTMEPGVGFFGLAAEMGRDVSNKNKCWIEELETVFDYWSKRP